MSASNYAECLRRLLLHEGGYSNNPSDPGGPTNFGITLADYRKYIKPNAGALDVRAMKVDEAKAIYKSKYWDALQGDRLPSGVDDSIFDYGVNSGIARAGKVLRRVLKLPDDDWKVTPEVMAALNKADAPAIIAAISNERLRFLKGLNTWPVFGVGWERRVAEVRAFSLALAAQQLPSTPAAPAPGKAHEPPPVTPSPLAAFLQLIAKLFTRGK
jgi:lysozyme family protein